MKEVIIKEVRTTVSIEDINDKSIVGIQWDDKSKSFILFSNKGYYTTNLTEGGVLSKYYNESIEGYVAYSLEEQDAKVFLFETYGELFEWLKDEQEN